MPLPPFPLEGGVPLALARGLAVAGLFAVFGGALARVAVLPPALVRLEEGVAALLLVRWRRLMKAGLAVAVAGLLGWAWLVAGTLADPPGLAGTMATLPVLLGETGFGYALAGQLAGLGLAGVCVARRWRWLTLGCAALALELQAGHGHAFAMDPGPSLLLASDLIHLSAGAAWLGGLPSLLLVVATAPDGALAACRRFSPLGAGCVLALAVTAGWQGWVLIGSLPALIGTGYGLMALLKLGLFAALLGLAAWHRFRLMPTLAAGDPLVARRLARSIALEAGLGLAVVLAAGVLSGLPPGMHVQPLWPFAWRPSLEIINEDMGFRREVLAAGLALAGAVALLVVAVLLRHRARWLAVAVALMVAWRATPHLDLLLVEAYPTSFYRSPTGFAAIGIVAGAATFGAHCAGCHGASGRGDGPAAGGLPVPPADLTAAHLWGHSDGALFWWLSHGIDTPGGAVAMPGFAKLLPAAQRWQVIDYIRAHNAGLALQNQGRWPVPVQGPGFQAHCADRREMALSELRGQVVWLLIGRPAHMPRPPAGVVAVIASDDPALRPRPGVCITSDGAVPLAYAIAAGLANEAEGVQFLLDAGGWLRDMQRADATTRWSDAAVLAAALRRLRAHELPAMDNPHAQMHM